MHASFTGGHASAAKAIKTALDRHPGVETEVINISESSTSPFPTGTAAENALEGGQVVNWVRTWGFEQNLKGNLALKLLQNAAVRVDGLFNSAFLKRIHNEKPDLIISTMSPTNSLLSQWRAAGAIDTPVQSVVTDFGAHQMWAQSQIERYYVATDGARQDLTRFGIEPERVVVTGIPIGSDFGRPPQASQQARQSLGLEPDKPMVLMMGGSLGYANFDETIDALDALPQDFQMAVITGRNEEARASLAARQTKHPLRVEGFVSNMPDWTDAADMVVSKPGGLSTSEVLARGRPMLLKDALPGLEEHMVDRVVATGAALAIEDADHLGQTVARLLEQPDQAQRMTEAARVHGHPEAAERVAQLALASLAQ
ncbi:MAG: glycosyltransferase [Candidatus Eremiobacteraeota bacterium]|nr:glycosyltransferase [Candidatus Eremiobacteraeota bacterium]